MAIVKRVSAIRVAVDDGVPVKISVLRVKDGQVRTFTWEPTISDSLFVLGLRVDSTYENPDGLTYISHVAHQS